MRNLDQICKLVGILSPLYAIGIGALTWVELKATKPLGQCTFKYDDRGDGKGNPGLATIPFNEA